MDCREIIINDIDKGIVNIQELNNKLDLRSENIDNLKEFYNAVFDICINENIYFKFILSEELVCEEIDKEIAKVLFETLNSEIESSKSDLEYIIDNKAYIKTLEL